MQLIGMLDSPYVRRAAISLRMLGLPFEHLALSVFRDAGRFGSINPVVKAPTLVLDDGTQLIDSTLIVDYAEALSGRSLLPAAPAERLRALRLIGLAMAACEKTVQIVYEHNLRPPEKQHAPWLERLRGQLDAAYGLLEPAAAAASPWLDGARFGQADLTVAVAWSFTRLVLPELAEPAAYPALASFAGRAEALPEFRALPAA